MANLMDGFSNTTPTITNFTAGVPSSGFNPSQLAAGISAGSGVLGSLLNGAEQSKANKQAAATLLANLASQAAQYDYRGNILDSGNKALGDYADQNFAQTQALNGQIFDARLGNTRESADALRDNATMVNNSSNEIERAKLDSLLNLDDATTKKVLDNSATRQNELIKVNSATLDELLGNSRARADTLNNLSKTTFDYQQGNAQAGFSEQLDATRQGFDQEMSARGGLITKQRQIREDQQKLTETERARQMEYQGQADTLGAALAGSMGTTANAADMSKSQATRQALLTAIHAGPSAPAYTPVADPTIRRAYAAEQARAQGEANTDNTNSAKLSSYGDALDAGNARVADTGQRVGVLARLAETSRNALPSELAFGNLEGRDAQDAASAAIAMAKSQAEGKINISKTYHGALADAMSDYASGAGQTYGTYYDAMGNNISGSGARVSGATGNYYDALGGIIGDNANRTAGAIGGYYDDRTRNIQGYGSSMTDALKGFYGGKDSALTGYGTNQGNSINNYFTGASGAMTDWMQGQIGSSQNYENTLTSLANYKAQNTKSTGSFLGNLLGAAGSIAKAFI